MDLTPSQIDEFVAGAFPQAFRSGSRCEAVGEGFAVARWLYDEGALRPGGFVPGPTQFATADIALWFMTFTLLGLQPMAVTSDLAITFLRPAVGGDLLARADLLRAGATRITGRVSVWVEGDDGRPVAEALGSYAVLT